MNSNDNDTSMAEAASRHSEASAETARAAYRRLLESAEIMELEARFGLNRGIRYELVDARRSFHGKAAVVAGRPVVRLPDNPRPLPYLLLTLLHEWAHLLVHHPGQGKKTSLVWQRLDQAKNAGARERPLPHGKEWRAHYHALVEAAVQAGLFPGNEEEVLRHAAAGEARTLHANLLGEDGALLIPPTPQPAPRFHAGDTVRFTDRQGRILTGKVTQVNQRTYTVVLHDNTRVYRVPFTYPLLAREGEAIPRPTGPEWYPGLAVRFITPTGQSVTGKVVRVNRLTLTIDTDDGHRYRVGYEYPSLRRVKE